MAPELIDQQNSDGSASDVHSVIAVVKTTPGENDIQAPPNSNDPVVDIIEELSVVPISLSEPRLPNNDDHVHSNDTVIDIEKEPLSLVPVPLDETDLAAGDNNNGNDAPAGRIFFPRIRRWLHYYIPNLRVDIAIMFGNFILKLMVNCETDLGEMLLCFRLGNIRFYRLPFNYSIYTGWNNFGIGQPSYYTPFPIQLNLQFGIAVEYRDRIVRLTFDNTQNSRDLLRRDGYYRLFRLQNFNFYLQYFRLWWNERL